MAEPEIISSTIRDIQCGEHVRIVEPVNLYGCTLQDDVFVGPFVEIQCSVTIGPRTRVQSHAFICEFITIGSDCFISHGVVFINDDFRSGGPAGGDRNAYGHCKVGNHVSIGSNATILPVCIADGCVIGAGAVVTKDLTVKGVYAGNPARLMRELD